MFEGLSANHTFLTIVITFLYDKTLESCVSESTEADSLNVTWNIYLLNSAASKGTVVDCFHSLWQDDSVRLLQRAKLISPIYFTPCISTL